MLTGNLTIGQFFPGDSILHRLDPRIKITGVVLYIIALFAINNTPGYLMAIGYISVVAGLSKIPAGYLLRGIKPLWWIVIFILGIHFFFTPGAVVWQWKICTLTLEGITMGVSTALRLVMLIFITSLLTFTTSPINLTDGIERLLSPLQPLGVPAHEIALMMTIALRFIPTLLEEAGKLIKAQTARGADFSTGNIIVKAANVLPIMVPLFISAFRRAEELALAMEARCYRGGQGRTRMWEMEIGSTDIAALVAACGLVVSVVVLRLTM